MQKNYKKHLTKCLGLMLSFTLIASLGTGCSRFLTIKTDDEQTSENSGEQQSDKDTQENRDGPSVKPTPEKKPQEDPSKEMNEKIEEEKASGRMVIEGTLFYLSYMQVLDMQQLPNPNPEYIPEGVYVILTFPSQQIEAHDAGSAETRMGSANMILLSEFERDPEYDGAEVAVSIDPNMIYWPSDVSVPIGQPRTSGAYVIE